MSSGLSNGVASGGFAALSTAVVCTSAHSGGTATQRPLPSPLDMRASSYEAPSRAQLPQNVQQITSSESLVGEVSSAALAQGTSAELVPKTMHVIDAEGNDHPYEIFANLTEALDLVSLEVDFRGTDNGKNTASHLIAILDWYVAIEKNRGHISLGKFESAIETATGLASIHCFRSHFDGQKLKFTAASCSMELPIDENGVLPAELTVDNGSSLKLHLSNTSMRKILRLVLSMDQLSSIDRQYVISALALEEKPDQAGASYTTLEACYNKVLERGKFISDPKTGMDAAASAQGLGRSLTHPPIALQKTLSSVPMTKAKTHLAGVTDNGHVYLLPRSSRVEVSPYHMRTLKIGVDGQEHACRIIYTENQHEDVDWIVNKIDTYEPSVKRKIIAELKRQSQEKTKFSYEDVTSIISNALS